MTMQAELRKISGNNQEECIALRVTEEQEKYIVSNRTPMIDIGYGDL